MDLWTPAGILTWSSDFGDQDGYVGAMKGVALTVAGESALTMVDIAHGIPAQDVGRGSMTLRTACPRFPVGTVHVAVVDPGVGTARAAVVAVAGGHAFVAPDNGLLGPVLEALGGADAVFVIEEHRWLPSVRSSTFHGRDVFAPTGAALAAGLLSPDEVGAPAGLQPKPWPAVAMAGGTLSAPVVNTDRFGNLITAARVEDLRHLGPLASLQVTVPGLDPLPVLETYGDVNHGEFIALVGSEGYLEIAVRDGSAAERVTLDSGARVRITRP